MEAMVVAKILLGSDNDSYMYTCNYPNCCEVCHYVIKQQVTSNFKLKKRNYDISYTYDGYLIVSKRFKKYCEFKNYRNLIFHTIDNEPEFFFMESTQIIPLDYKRREVMFIDLCSVCNRYAEVIGATPSYLESEFEIEKNRFYRSEYEFGSYNYKSPLIIVSLEIATDLANQKFRGLYFKDVLI